MNPVHEQVRALLRADIASIVIGTIVTAAGLAAIAISCARWKTKNWLLLSFGSFSGLYGVRMLADTRSIQWMADAPYRFWGYVTMDITFLILIPGFWFSEQVVLGAWKKVFRILIALDVLYGAVAIVVGLLRHNPTALPDPAIPLLIALAAGMITAAWLGHGPRMVIPGRALGIGALIFFLFVANQHLVNARMVPWREGLEPAGFLAFLVCLGYVAVHQFFENEQRLAAIAREMEAAARIQSSILPRETPAMRGLRIAVRYRPMVAVAAAPGIRRYCYGATPWGAWTS